jgi:lipoprotein-anchoring transpeptidase ErfK/SrfK
MNLEPSRHHGFSVRGIVLAALMISSVAAGTLRAQEIPAAPSKRVEIDKTTQMLRAYEGDRLVLQSRVSTGRRNGTPSGSYRVQGKQRMHYSRLYDNAPMPYSVQFHGHYFIHGFTSVPNRPASHGCVRLPLKDGNPAKVFFEWVEVGTPIEITGRWR